MQIEERGSGGRGYDLSPEREGGRGQREKWGGCRGGYKMRA